AEIARETYRTGDYVVPHFVGRPFLEKPPLYYVALATIVRFSGVNLRFAPIARFFSLLCGWTMVVCVCLVAADALSERGVLTAVLLTLQMTAFWKYSHTIL